MSNNERILAQENQDLAKTARIKYYDIVLEKGAGAIITDVDHHQYIDLLASAIQVIHTLKLLEQFKNKLPS